MSARRRTWQPACGGQTVQPASERLAVCLVCHRHIPEGRGLGFPHLRSSACRVACADLVRALGRAGGDPSRARWRPRGAVWAAIDGARCPACRGWRP